MFHIVTKKKINWMKKKRKLLEEINRTMGKDTVSKQVHKKKKRSKQLKKKKKQ